MHLLMFLADTINISPLPHVQAGSGQIKNILNITFAVIGALSLLFITIGGLRYVISTGDPQKTAQAKNTILYAIIGLLVAIGAEAFVSFVLGNI